MENKFNQVLETAMSEFGYSMEDVPKEFLQETPEEEFHHILKGGGLHEE